MAIRNIFRGPTKAGGYPGTGSSAPIYVDSDDSKLKFIPGGPNSTTEVVVVDGATGLTDAGGTVKLLPNSAAKTISDGAATALFSVPVAASTMIGGMGNFLVRASDGTDFQTIAGIFTYSAEAKATVVVGAITYVAANEAKSVSAGTLTLAFTADVSVANVVTYKLQPTGSLTETTPYTVEYTLFPIRGVATIL
jgi:hypothetical protein